LQKSFISHNQEETENFAKELASDILSEKNSAGQGAIVVALFGDLGAGKTTFARAFAEALGVKEKAKSPTFIIFRKSRIKNLPAGEAGQESRIKNFYHFDVYRIHNEKEILNLGWEEIISNPQNIVLVEWAEKIEKILPDSAIRIEIKHLKDNEREIAVNF